MSHRGFCFKQRLSSTGLPTRQLVSKPQRSFILKIVSQFSKPQLFRYRRFVFDQPTTIMKLSSILLFLLPLFALASVRQADDASERNVRGLQMVSTPSNQNESISSNEATSQ
jgi:hypothetical protein